MIVIAACAPGASAPPWAGTIEERAGVVHVINPAEPLWPSEQEPRLRLQLEQVFGVAESPAEAMLGRIYDLAVDPAGHVYVLDYQDLRIVAFGSDGEVLWDAGREGEGPGEFQGPLSIGLDGEALYVTNRFGTLLDRWGTDGSFRDQTSLASLGLGRAHALRALSPGQLGMVTGDHEPQTEVSVVDVRSAPTLVRSFDVDADSLPPTVARGRTAPVAGRIVTGSIQDYRFRVYSPDGDLLRVVSLPDRGFVSTYFDADSNVMALMGNLEPPVRLPDGRWLAQARWPTNIPDPAAWIRRAREDRPGREYRHVLDLFDPEGRWLTGLTWDYPASPDHGTVHSIGPDGKLYTVVSDPFPQVRRYGVVVEAPE